jgi:hypothetical protein
MNFGLGGITIMTPAHMILLSIVNMLDGIVLALAFFLL